tara:strand:+ start:139 stop:525 length:387 start_codon:yes stop_codon:yes gene_type:complete
MSTIKANTLLHSDGSTTTQPSIPALDKRMAKVWGNFKGNNTVAINSSYGVSSITDLATGSYRVSFSTNFANINYASFADTSDNNQNTALLITHTAYDSKAVGSEKVMAQTDDGNIEDVETFNYLAFSN